MGVHLAVAPGGGFTSATATLKINSTDRAGVVTFITSMIIPAAPYLLFTIIASGSWSTPYANGPTMLVGACANCRESRTPAEMAAAAALGPFYVIPDPYGSTFAVYCSKAPAQSTAYDIGYICMMGP